MKKKNIIAGVPFCPEALFDRRATADDETPDAPIGRREIVKGLDGMSQVAETGNTFFFSSRRRHTIFKCDWSSDVCSSDLVPPPTRSRSHTQSDTARRRP